MNLSVLLDMAADGFGDRTVIGRRTGGLTARRLRELSIGGARAIRAARADAVIYLAPNGPAFPVALFAAARAGVPLVPINYRLGAEQLTMLLANHPGAIGISPTGAVDRLAQWGMASSTTDDWLAAIAELADDTDERTDPDPATAAALIYTSGTTSAPKGVLLRHENLTSYVLGSVEFGGAGADEASLISVPPYHIAAVANAITNLYAGRRTVVLEQFDASQWLALVREEQITHALVVPTMVARLMERPESELAVPSLRNLAYGGAPMPARVLARALASWSHVGFVNAYGLTETSSTVAVLGPIEHREASVSADPLVRARLSSVGRPVESVDLEIRDDAGQLVGAGAVGRIWVRGAQVSGAYAGSEPVVDTDGYFDTRDRGYLDADGYLFVLGRADDTIIRGAENIAPAEIEDVLLRHPDVEDAVVVGIPDEVWGERLAAAVVLRPGSSLEPGELQAHVRESLRSSKTPDRILFWTELPRTETGKLIRREAVTRIVAG